MIEVLDLFSSAAGGWSLGMHRAGFTTIAGCEIEPWRRALYSENNPNVKVYNDVRTLTANRLRADLGRLPSVVVGSPPCQDISSANTNGKGVEGARSGLYFEAIRIIREVRPRWFALENSANLRTRGADAVSAALEAIGYACWPCVVRAGDSANSRSAGIGANHERPRCWLIGCDLEQVGDAGSWTFDTEPRGHDRAGSDNARSHPAADAAEPGYAGRSEVRSGREARDQHARDHDTPGSGSLGSGNPPDANQTGQAHGRMEPSVRQKEVADDGCSPRWGDDRPRTGQMGLCPQDRRDVGGSGPLWSLADFADHLRLDDGISSGLAGARVALGNGKGKSAASLIVEAFGDAVVPQIPEAIGRAILRTERALATIYGGTR